jgi:predicted nucleotidyltransferase
MMGCRGVTGHNEDKARAIRAFGKRHHIRTLSVPDCALGDECAAEGDVEVLVAFAPEHIPGLMRLAGMQEELGEILGCRVRIQTAQDLSRYYRQQHLDAVDSEEEEFAKELRGPWKFFL